MKSFTQNQRIVLCALFVLVFSTMASYRIILRNGPGFEAYPVASILGGVTPSVVVGAGLFWVFGHRFFRRRVQEGSETSAYSSVPADSTDSTALAKLGTTVLWTKLGAAILGAAALGVMLAFLLSAIRGGNVNNPRRLPSSLLANLSATGSPIGNGLFRADIYNSSRNWHISEVVVSITARSEKRIFRLYAPAGYENVELNPNGTLKSFKPTKTALMPLSNGSFQANIGSFLDGLQPGQWTWTLVEGYGFRE